MALAPYAEGRQDKARHQEAGKHHVRQNPDVRAGLGGGHVDEEQDDDVGQSDGRQRKSGETEVVAQ